MESEEKEAAAEAAIPAGVSPLESIDRMDTESVHAVKSESEATGSREKNPSGIAVAKVGVLPEEFLQKLEGMGTVEEKLEHTLSFMKHALEGKGGHHFREFWDARKLCTEFFTQNIHPSMRVRLWAEYTDICREARVLKEMFDEESSYLVEQIEGAIEVVEAELPLFEEKGSHLPPTPEFVSCASIAKHLDRYEMLHHELTYLNSFASRIAALRKELLKTDMRYKARHKLLDRLTKLGDTLFPKRKQVISEVSALFLDDVETFVRSMPVAEMKPHALFEVREEIKRLQMVAKLLTLSTDAFGKTRVILSDCWEAIKNVLKEQRKADHEKRELFKKHREELLEEISKVEAGIAEGKISSFDAKKALHALSHKMREIPLAHQDVRMLRDKLKEVEEAVPQQAVSEVKSSGKKEEKERAAKYQMLLDQLKAVNVEDQERVAQEIFQELKECPFTRQEKLNIEKELALLRGQIIDRRLQEASQDLEGEVSKLFLSLEHLRADCKQQVDLWRKETSGSTSDFSLAMQYTDLIEEERSRLDRIEKEIERLSE